ncbi:MAG: ABC transporter permease [Verrucomicrobia bacterium]|nr:ABC transporter permease [Verrucomicrobiota bacterium]
MLSDFRFALRSLTKTPGFTAVAVLTMAVAIGACTALFSVLQAVVLRPLPYPDPDNLVSVWAVNRERNLQAPAISWDKFLAFRERKDVFRELSLSAGNAFTLTEGKGEPEQVFGQQVSANFLPVLGLTPARGRNFHEDEDRAGGAPVAMISQRLWQTRFGSDPAIIGRVIQIDGVAREVIALLPPTMPVPFNNTDVVVTQARELPYLQPQQRDYAVFHQAIGRLAPGVTLEQASARLREMARQFATANAGKLDAANENEARTLTTQVLGNLGQTFWTLAGAVAAVLLIACANIANLFLARVSARQKEIAVRMSLGARPAEVVRQFLTESLVFTAVASVLGVLLAWWSLQGIQFLAGQQLPRGNEIVLDGGVLAFAVGVALFGGLLIGVYPAIQAARTDVGSVLKDNTRGAGGGSAARSFRHLLVIAQIALSLTLLICAGLLVRSFYRLRHAEPGFATTGRAFGVINLPAARYGTPELIREFYARAQERLRTVPGLERAALTANLPLAGGGFLSPYLVQGRPVVPFSERPLATISNVSADYFATIGITLKSGRFFADTDRASSQQVAIINTTLARKLFPAGDALDHSFVIGPNSDIITRIVGIVQDVKTNGLNVPPPDEIYYPLTQRGPGFCNLVGLAKPGLAAPAVIPLLRRALAELDPALALATPQTLDDLLTQSIGVQRLTLALLLAFAAIAALLATVGVYSVMAYAVTQRTGEIGVRLALGASRRDILQLILRSGAVQIGLGLLLGLAGALAASRLLTQALYEVKPFDPAVFAIVAVFFAVIATLACLIPARRATRVDPIEALRVE